MTSTFPSHNAKPQLGDELDPHQRHHKKKWDQPVTGADAPLTSVDSKDEQQNIAVGDPDKAPLNVQHPGQDNKGDELKLQSSGSIQDQDKGKLQNDTRATSTSAQTSMNDARRHTEFHSNDKADRAHLSQQLQPGGQMGQQVRQDLQGGMSQNLRHGLAIAPHQRNEDQPMHPHDSSAADSNTLDRQRQQRQDMSNSWQGKGDAGASSFPSSSSSSPDTKTSQIPGDPTEPRPLPDDSRGARGADLAMDDLGGMRVGDVERMQGTHTGSDAGARLASGGATAMRVQSHSGDVSGPSGKDVFGMQQGAERQGS